MPAISWEGRRGVWRSGMYAALGGERVAGVLCWEDLTDPFAPMYNETTEGIVDLRHVVMVSEDGGETWSEPRRIPGGRFDDVPLAITGPILLMPDGRWAFSCEVNKTYHDASPWQHHSIVMFSEDEGATWTEPVVTHTDPQRRVFCWDQRVSALSDGRMLVMYWTFDREAAVYLNMHAAESTDGGATFSAVWDTGVPGQPAPVVDLGDGRLVLVYVDRTDRPTIKARVSRDGGRSFDADSELIIHDRGVGTQIIRKGGMNDAWDEMNDYSVGLPAATPLGGGEMLVVYYTGPHADATDIQWARLRG